MDITKRGGIIQFGTYYNVYLKTTKDDLAVRNLVGVIKNGNVGLLLTTNSTPKLKKHTSRKQWRIILLDKKSLSCRKLSYGWTGLILPEEDADSFVNALSCGACPVDSDWYKTAGSMIISSHS